jgi:hypothetical protein
MPSTTASTGGPSSPGLSTAGMSSRVGVRSRVENECAGWAGAEQVAHEPQGSCSQVCAAGACVNGPCAAPRSDTLSSGRSLVQLFLAQAFFDNVPK